MNYLLKDYNHKEIAAIDELDDEVDFLHEKIIYYIIQIARHKLNMEHISQTYRLIAIIACQENIGDKISKNIINIIKN